MPDVTVAIIGSGFGGIGMAASLSRAGITDVVLLERAADLGGTWRDNSYPGAACDVPSHLYSFSFAPNPDWSRSFSPQPEIWEYLRRVAAEEGVTGKIRFGQEVTSARWDPAARLWRVETTASTLTARFLVSAAGPLSDPMIPDIPGLDTFAGPVFHSATWDHDYDLTGRNVAVIGTGASAIQFVPRIQPLVGQLTLFQRTPAWIMPRHDRQISRVERWLFRHVPVTQQTARAGIYCGREAYALGFRQESGHHARGAGRGPASPAPPGRRSGPAGQAHPVLPDGLQADPALQRLLSGPRPSRTSPWSPTASKRSARSPC